MICVYFIVEISPKEKMLLTRRVALLGLLCLFAIVGYGQDLRYTPKNPAFGGNTFNYQWLLSGAQAQNGLTDVSAARTSSSRTSSSRSTTLDDFTESLNRQLLNSITRQLFDLQIGNGGLTEGSYSLGNFQVDVVEGADGVIITIVDIVNGGTTEVVVPYF